MYLARDFPSDGSMIPFTDRQQTMAFIAISEIGLCIPFGILFLYALCRQRNIPMDSQFIISMIAADLAFSGMELILGSWITHSGGWVFGKSGCVINGILVLLTLGPSVLSVVGLTGFRYLAIIHQIYPTQAQTSATIAGIWILTPFNIGVFMAAASDFQSLFGLQPSGLYCMVTGEHRQLVNIIAGSAVFCYIFIPIVFIIVCYWQIVSKYHRMQKTQRAKEAQSSSPSSKKRINPAQKPSLIITTTTTLGDNEWKLIKKSVAIAGTFSGTWILFCAKTVYEVVSGNSAPFWLDQLWGLIATLNPLINCMILYKYDGKVRSNVRELLYLEWIEGIWRERWTGVKERVNAVVIKVTGSENDMRSRSNLQPQQHELVHTNGVPVVLLFSPAVAGRGGGRGGGDTRTLMAMDDTKIIASQLRSPID